MKQFFGLFYTHFTVLLLELPHCKLYIYYSRSKLKLFVIDTIRNFIFIFPLLLFLMLNSKKDCD